MKSIDKLLKGVEAAYKKDLKRFKSTGGTEKSLRRESTDSSKGSTGRIYAQKSIYYLFHGRKPGKFPPISVMLDYIRTERIRPKGKTTERQLAFLFARAIAKKGTKIYQGKVKPLNVDDQIKELQAKFLKDFNIDTKKLISQSLSNANDF